MPTEKATAKIQYAGRQLLAAGETAQDLADELVSATRGELAAFEAVVIQPTVLLRWAKYETHPARTLEQAWQRSDGKIEWREIETVNVPAAEAKGDG